MSIRYKMISGFIAVALLCGTVGYIGLRVSIGVILA
ncbi:unnamed protein product, partial [marine sediment metagenome]